MVLAKLSRPRLTRVHRLTRLFERLDEARASRAVWIAGPAGSGKTTLVASYLAARRLATAWYHVDEGDRDVASFFHHLTLAIQRAAPRGEALPIYSPEYGPAPAAFARHFFREAWRRLGRRILVLDDYQDSRSPSPLDDVVRVALTELPERAGVLVASREPPPPGLARLLANGGLVCVGAPELRLTAAEAAGLARARGARSLTPRTVERLHRATGGWAAGLVLLLAAGHADDAASPSAPRRAPQELFDYFASEILDRASEPERRLLLETALLPRIPGEVAERVTGVAGARALFAARARGGHFVVRLDQREEVYEYHPLFRAFLLERGRSALGPERVRQVRLEAARLLGAAGDAQEVVELLHGAGAFDELGRLVGERAPELVREGRWQTLGEWLRLLPPEQREGQPWLTYWMGQSRLPVAPGEARAHFERAFQVFLDRGDAAGAYLSWAGVTHSYIYEWGDFAPLDRWIENIAELRRRWPRAPTPEIEAAAVGGMFTALMWRQPGHPDLPAWRARAREVVLGGADVRLRRALAIALSHIECWRLDPEGARRCVGVLAPTPGEAVADPAGAVHYHAARANVAAFLGDHADALRAAEEGLALAGTLGLRFWEPVLHFGAASAYLVRDDVEGARAALRAMDRSLDRRLRGNEGMYEQLASMISLRAGERSRALRHAERALELARACGAPWWQGMAEVARAAARLAMGERRDAEAFARAGPPGHPPCFLAGRSYASAVAAAAALRRGDEDLAAELLAAPFEAPRAVQLHLHLWIDRSQAAELCALALERGIAPEEARALVLAQELPAPRRAGRGWPWPVRIHTLGRFELEIGGEVLRFEGKSQRRPLELAKALIALGPTDVPESALVEALWPDADGDAGQHALETTAYRLRKLLGRSDAVQHRAGLVSLDRGRCWVDAVEVHELARRAAARAAQGGAGASALQALAEQGLAVYAGPFLPRDDHPWALAHRARTRRAMRRLIGLGVKALEDAGHGGTARELERRAAEADPELLQGPRLASA